MNHQSSIKCPECGKSCFLNIKDYKISLNQCENGHNINFVPLNELENCINKYDSKIFCYYCKKNKLEANKTHFYKFLLSELYLCESCKQSNNSNQKLISLEHVNYICNKDNLPYISYCKNCNKNLCSKCEIIHDKNHYLIKYSNMINNNNYYSQNLNDFMVKVKQFENEINSLINILNKVLYSTDIYSKLYNSIIKNESEYKNYQLLCNKITLNDFNQILLKDINKIINENNMINKFAFIKEMYDKMNNFNNPNGNEYNNNYNNNNFNNNYNSISLNNNNNIPNNINQINNNFLNSNNNIPNNIINLFILNNSN